MQAVYHLSTTRPHEPEGAAYTRAEWPIYCQGYHTALVAALRSMELELRKRKTLERERRRAARAARQAPARSTLGDSLRGGEVVRVSRDYLVEEVAERREGIEWKHEAMYGVAVAVDADEQRAVGDRRRLEGPPDEVGAIGGEHASHCSAEKSSRKRPSRLDTPHKSNKDNDLHEYGAPCGDTCPRGVPRKNSRNP